MLELDLTLTLIKATVQIDQPVGEGRRVVGTGFLVSIAHDDRPPEVVLVTAAHVLEKMHASEARIGWRIKGANGEWFYKPSQLQIRGKLGPLWVQHPTQDVALIPIDVPPSNQDGVISESMLADEETFADYKISPGDEMMTLGYPHGLSANNQGFPILRAGRVASYPLGPIASYPTFLIDLTAVPGNSGGPVFMTDKSNRNPDTEIGAVAFITGILTRQVEQDTQRLELGLVTHAIFVRQTIDLLRKKEAMAEASLGEPRLAEPRLGRVGAPVAPSATLRTPEANQNPQDTTKSPAKATDGAQKVSADLTH